MGQDRVHPVQWKGDHLVFDPTKLMAMASTIETFTTDVDSRLQQIANQQQITNGLLAFLALSDPRFATGAAAITETERVVLDHLYDLAFGDRVSRNMPQPDNGEDHDPDTRYNDDAPPL